MLLFPRRPRPYTLSYKSLNSMFTIAIFLLVSDWPNLWHIRPVFYVICKFLPILWVWCHNFTNSNDSEGFWLLYLAHMTYCWSYLWFIGFKSLIKNTTPNYKLVSRGQYNLLYNCMFCDEAFLGILCGDSFGFFTLETAFS